jgi:hypothetical protein
MMGRVVSVSWLALCQYVACMCKERTSLLHCEKGLRKMCIVIPRFFWRVRTSRFRKFAGSPQGYKYNTLNCQWTRAPELFDVLNGSSSHAARLGGKKTLASQHNVFANNRKTLPVLKVVFFFWGGGGGRGWAIVLGFSLIAAGLGA